jgi:hypothetical protein
MTSQLRSSDVHTAPLPRPRGPISAEVISRLRSPADIGPWPIQVGSGEPYGEDVQLALAVLYEMHYRGFDGVDAEWEWMPGPLGVRAQLEQLFLRALRRDVPERDDPDAVLDDLCHEARDAWGLSHQLAAYGTWEQVREYFVHRSIYHLKEADPNAWAIPRLTGRSKAALVAVEFDEYGGGHAERLHSRLFANLLVAAGLRDDYLGYLECVPADTLATVNFMSLCGLHRARIPMLVGMFAAVEITSSPGSRRMVSALERLDAPRACITFYAEHVEADAVHELVLRNDVVGDLLAKDPGCAADIAFGANASEFLDGRLAQRLLTAWAENRSSLTAPVVPPVQ